MAANDSGAPVQLPPTGTVGLTGGPPMESALANEFLAALLR
jgi:hypothetical protein